MLHRPASPNPGPLSRSAGWGHEPITAANGSAGRSRTWCTADVMNGIYLATITDHKLVSASRPASAYGRRRDRHAEQAVSDQQVGRLPASRRRGGQTQVKLAVKRDTPCEPASR